MSIASTIGDRARPPFRLNRGWIAIGLIYAGLTITVIYPIALILMEAFLGDRGLDLAKVAQVFSSSDILRATRDTVWMSILSVVMASVIGVTLAWLVARTNMPFKRVSTRST